MTLLDAIILGLVQGLTEFLPVSSSGHLVMGQKLLGIQEHSLEFDVLVHVATLFAVLFYFRSDVKVILRDCMRGVKQPEGGKTFWHAESAYPGARFAAMVVLGSVPTAAIGLTFEKTFEALFSSVRAVGVALLVTSFLLLLTWWKARTAPSIADEQEAGDATLTPGRSVLIGITQGLAITPGISRSGSTIATGLLLGVARESAARFSFLLSLPAIFGALLLRSRHFSAIAPGEGLAYAAGFAVALLSGLAALALLMRIVQRGALHFFGFYTAAVGIAALLMG